MRNTKRLIGLALAAVIAGSVASTSVTSGAQAQTPKSTLDKILASKELRVGMTLQFKPEMYKDDAGKPAGYDVEVLNLLAQDLGVKLTISDLDFDGLVPGLLADKFDMVSVGLVGRPKRLTQMYFTNSYVPYEQVLAVPASSKRAASIDAFNKAGTKITALQGSSAEGQIKTSFPLATAKPFPQQDAAFLEVASGRADATVVERYLVAQFQKTNPGKIKIVELKPALNIEYGQWAIPKGDYDFLVYLNNWLQYYKNNGTLEGIYARTIAPVGQIWPRQ